MRRSGGAAGLLATLFVMGTPAQAEAQWHVTAYLGANATHPAPVSIAVPADGIALVYEDVHFRGEPFKSPQYYGVRIGRLFGEQRRLGLEVEFIHLKVLAETARHYPVSGSFGSTPGADLSGPMSDVVARYAMTHGLNFLVVNLVSRTPLTNRFDFVARGGAGPTIPHTETTVLGQSVDRYELAGLGAHAAAGVEAAMGSRMRAFAEYKFTFARPTITVAGGAGRTTAATHHLAFGIILPFGR
jgi:hypothetical protein